MEKDLENKISKLQISNKENKSPLRYPGGKTRACKKLDEILNKYFQIEQYNNIISPFFGGGSFEFYIQNKYNLNIIANDKFIPLYNFWYNCKYDKELLCTNLYQNINIIDKEIFNKYRKNILIEDNKLQQAIMYFIINRCSFSGATLSGGFSLESSKKRFTISSIDRINKLNLNNFNIFNYDFEEFLKKYNSSTDETNLIFLDPPYYLENKSKLYGNNGDMHENFNHNQLYQYISKKSNWLMTYNNCEFIKNLYQDFQIIETEWSYSMNKSKQSSELVIIG